jgi:hypothetical protein
MEYMEKKGVALFKKAGITVNGGNRGISRSRIHISIGDYSCVVLSRWVNHIWMGGGTVKP